MNIPAGSTIVTERGAFSLNVAINVPDDHLVQAPGEFVSIRATQRRADAIDRDDWDGRKREQKGGE